MTINEVLSLVLLVLFTILLSFQIRKYGVHSWEILKRVKTWVYIFAILELFFIFLSNLIKPTAIKWGWAVFIDIAIAMFR